MFISRAEFCSFPTGLFPCLPTDHMLPSFKVDRPLELQIERSWMQVQGDTKTVRGKELFPPWTDWTDRHGVARTWCDGVR